MLTKDSKAAAPNAADIVIAGGGFVGLSLALALARLAPQGLRLALIEGTAPAAAAAGDARASAISAASRNMLDALGIWPQIAAHAQEIAEIEITDGPKPADGPQIALLDFENRLEAGAPGAYVMENAVLLRALAEAVAAEPGIAVVAPERVDDFEASGSAIAVHLQSGSVIAAKLLVAADGRRSRLRDIAGIKTVGWSYPQMGIVATVHHAKPHRGKAIQHFLPAGPFALLPLPGNRTSIVWSEKKSEAERLMQCGDAEFLRELSVRFGSHLGEISLDGPHQAFPLSLHVARNFVAQRFALIGDAAHGVHPLAGQGLNIGFRDVAALAEILVEGMRLGLDPGDAALLQRYERWRRFDSASSALAMDLMNRAFSNDNPVLRSMRDFGLDLVQQMPPLKRFFVREAAGQEGKVPRLLQGKRL